MTGKDIFDTAINLMLEDAPEDYIGFALPLLNVLLTETFDVNNSNLEWNGKEPLKEIPVMLSIEENCPYDSSLTKLALPYGLAAKLIFDDGDTSKFSYLQNQYVAFTNAVSKTISASIVDVYGGDEV